MANPFIEKPRAPERRAGTQPEKREAASEIQRALLKALSSEHLSPEAAIEMLASFPEEVELNKMQTRVDTLANAYGLEAEDLSSEDRTRLALYALPLEKNASPETADEMTNIVDKELHEALVKGGTKKIDAFQAVLEDLSAKPSPEHIEKIKGSLRETLASMANLAKRIPPEQPGNAPAWRAFHEKFYAMVSLKKQSETAVNKAFDEVFQEFSDFIDDEFVARELVRQTQTHGYAETEEAMRMVYGRSKEDIEGIKKQNRKSVAAAIMRLKEEPYVTIDMIEELHRLNNKGIVPKSESKMRKGEEMVLYGKARVGIVGDDVRDEMNGVMQNAEGVIDNALVENWSKARYEIAAAKLHNDILDIHPFGDRNGSTSLLFLELMMAKKGYVPSPDREKNYYNHLRKILGNNPLAIGVVTHMQYKVAHEAGHFEGTTTKPLDKKVIYDFLVGQRMAELEA